jgi:hypothetical protein
MLYRVSGTKDQGLAAFARLTGLPSAQNVVSFYADSGLTYIGLFATRPNEIRRTGGYHHYAAMAGPNFVTRAVLTEQLDYCAYASSQALAPERRDLGATSHPVAPDELPFGVGKKDSTFSDHGMRWDNSGKNGHYAPINWSN